MLKSGCKHFLCATNNALPLHGMPGKCNFALPSAPLPTAARLLGFPQFSRGEPWIGSGATVVSCSSGHWGGRGCHCVRQPIQRTDNLKTLPCAEPESIPCNHTRSVLSHTSSVRPPNPPLPVSSRAPRGPVPLGLQFVIPLVRYPHSLFLFLSSSVSDLLATPSPKVRENKGEEIQTSQFAP